MNWTNLFRWKFLGGIHWAPWQWLDHLGLLFVIFHHEYRKTCIAHNLALSLVKGLALLITCTNKTHEGNAKWPKVCSLSENYRGYLTTQVIWHHHWFFTRFLWVWSNLELKLGNLLQQWPFFWEFYLHRKMNFCSMNHHPLAFKCLHKANFQHVAEKMLVLL